MTLAFSTKIKGKPTYFVEKIWRGLVDKLGYSDPNYHFDEIQGLGNVISGVAFGKALPKIHTIRRDNKNRWIRQMHTDYADLTDREKQSDIDQVKKFIHLF